MCLLVATFKVQTSSQSHNSRACCRLVPVDFDRPAFLSLLLLLLSLSLFFFLKALFNSLARSAVQSKRLQHIITLYKKSTVVIAFEEAAAYNSLARSAVELRRKGQVRTCA